jgi:hypothetical protein
MEKKGYMENKKGKMIKKADKLTAKMSVKKKGKNDEREKDNV